MTCIMCFAAKEEEVFPDAFYGKMDRELIICQPPKNCHCH